MTDHTPSLTTKQCTKCHRTLPLSAFQSEPRKPLGVTAHCKDCKRAYRQANKRKLLAAQYARRTNNPDYDRKRVAWNALYRALRTGKIEKPDDCTICGAYIGHDNIQGHHEDYDKPFDVIWCCQDCHVMLDEERRESEAGHANS